MTNVLKRLFSKEDKSGDKANESAIELLPASSPHPKMMTGSTNIVNQVIEEVDEQLTITSQIGIDPPRPSVMNIFGPPTPSKPVDVPKSRNRYGIRQNFN